uniref:CAP-Gly domain-containing protein n=1 Tax=Odontella aurita TaxID=265563 RepID=A0A7S4JYB2_9STRA|mmetsp:Transcript_56403/g.168817  ORF Transcript_56403/g.168817 Transcript_56403/m.168817 type:complete len:340 (+) Transcript_56403:188-1207(+)|eukprot:CAMPEP_0113550576 /NCGR_PEP_ID=MMETSP0015_2-20120614/14059_1 /TAXON_ID=2838 /ORGANISM="Odontella" /LENGTH=339 /DNA_ID=CAMNT_0000451399 /DNA_START=144 /DNA_END=1163 /DNA_ORIENTATION=- /assembly_acc=CAM_ASM_000160
MTTSRPPPAASINNEDLLALQSYVTARDDVQYDHLAATTVLIDLTHSNLTQRHAEIRFGLHDTIGTVRERIHQKTGTPPCSQRLQILRGASPDSGALFDISPGSDDERMLGYYSVRSGMTVHCVDVDPHSSSRGGAYEDTSLVKKYAMSDEDYDRRRGTLREWGRKQKEADPDFTLRKHAREHREMMEARRQAKLGLELPEGFELDGRGEVVRVEKEDDDEGKQGKANEKAKSSAEEEYGPDSVSAAKTGERCEVQPGGRRGRVAFAGEVPELGGGGHWAGVIFDEPVGKADGSVKGGKRYFEASPGFGGFVRGKNLAVGDFPERDIMDELDSDSEDEL